jgi:undecaprenyl-diphosphatase
MTLFDAFILGIVEGLAEFLPISSTGHMVLVSHFLEIPHSVTLTTFEIVIQLGAISAVVIYYFKHLFELGMIKKLIVGFLPTGIIGFFIFPYVKIWLQNPLLVAYSLLLGGILILLVERWYAKQSHDTHKKELSYKDIFLLGLFQALAMIPGVSRSGAMIIGGLGMKLNRAILAEFTFLLAVPTLIIATLYTLYKKHSELNFDALLPIGIGFITSFIVALIVIRFFLSYIKSHSFTPFGWYRIIAGSILLLILL